MVAIDTDLDASRKPIRSAPERAGESRTGLEPHIIARQPRRPRAGVRDLLLVCPTCDLCTDILERLRSHGYTTARVGNGRAGLQAMARPGSAAMVNWDLPDMDATGFLENLRSAANDGHFGPVVIFSEQYDAQRIADGLAAGAKDVLTDRDLRPPVLLARVRAALGPSARPRPASRSTDRLGIIHIGELEVDPESYRVRIGGHAVDLTLSEFRILHLLARRPGWVFGIDQIRASLPGESASDSTVKSHLSHLRRKLGRGGRWIETVRGVGYRAAEPS